MNAIRHPLAARAALLALAGCATYTTPGAGVSLADLAQRDSGRAGETAQGRIAVGERDIAEAMKAQPAARFPAHVVMVRVQATGYRSPTSASCFGEGRFCVMTVRDIESDEAYERLAKLPSVAALGPLNRLVLPERFDSLADLRRAAAMLQADLLLLHTVDTGFRVENTDIGPLALLSLGFLPNKKASVTATASAAIFDVRTGFIYGLAEATAVEEQRATMWSSSDAVDSARKSAEAEAFRRLTGEIEKLWGQVLRTHVAAR